MYLLPFMVFYFLFVKLKYNFKKLFTIFVAFSIIVVESGTKCMFFGSYQHILDAKGRMMIPSKFRSQIGEKVFIMRGYDRCISIYKEEDFLHRMEEAQKLYYNKEDPRRVVRVETRSVVELEIDDAGRILLPKKTLSNYEIGRKVMIVGVIDHFEVWDLDAWNKYIDEAEKSYETDSDNLKEGKPE